MTQEQKDQYNELEATAASLREEVEQARNQVDSLSREKEEFSKEIAGSQVLFLFYICMSVVTKASTLASYYETLTIPVRWRKIKLNDLLKMFTDKNASTRAA